MLAAQLLPDAPPLMRISCDRYHAMIAAGSLTPDDRVELIDGYLVTKVSIGPQHSAIVTRLQNLLVGRIGMRALVRTQNPITIHDYSEPEPDFVVAKYRDDFYAGKHPQPEDVLLVVEVADSSLAFDRNAKIPLYAAAGISQVWLVDVADRQIIDYRRPEGVVYGSVRPYRGGESVEIGAMAGITVSPSEIGL